MRLMDKLPVRYRFLAVGAALTTLGAGSLAAYGVSTSSPPSRDCLQLIGTSPFYVGSPGGDPKDGSSFVPKNHKGILGIVSGLKPGDEIVVGFAASEATNWYDASFSEPIPASVLTAHRESLLLGVKDGSAVFGAALISDGSGARPAHGSVVFEPESTELAPSWDSELKEKPSPYPPDWTKPTHLSQCAGALGRTAAVYSLHVVAEVAPTDYASLSRAA